MLSNAPVVKMLCQSCKRTGRHKFGSGTRPRFCRCKKRGGSFGPIVAAPGTILTWRFEPADVAAFREKCGLASNAERTARDEAQSAYWVACGKGYRRLPATSPRVIAAEAAYDAALVALEALQAVCPHEGRSPYAEEYCDCCHAHVESDIEQHRHMVREGFFDAAAE